MTAYEGTSVVRAACEGATTAVALVRENGEDGSLVLKATSEWLSCKWAPVAASGPSSSAEAVARRMAMATKAARPAAVATY